MICALAVTLSTAGCVEQLFPAWEVVVPLWSGSSDPFAGGDGQWHYPSPGNVWRYVLVSLRNTTAQPCAIALDAFRLRLGTQVYSAFDECSIPNALPLDYAPGAARTGRIAFEVPFPTPYGGGFLLVDMPGGPSTVVELTDSMQVY